MKLLMVVDFFPDPPVHGSSVISYHWAVQLRRRHALDLVCAGEARRPSWRDFFEAHGIGDPGVEVPVRRRLAQAMGVLAGYPPSVRRVRAEELVRRLEERAPVDQYDAAVVIGPSLLLVAEALQDRLPVLYVPYDAVSRVLEGRRSGWHDPIERLRWPLESRLWKRLEATRFPGLDGVVVVAQADADAVAAQWAAEDRRRLHVVTNGVDAGYFQPDGRPSVRDELVFTGNLWTYDSVTGARWFITEVLPRIRDAVPEVTLRLVGRDPESSLIALAERTPAVEVIPNVPDLRPYLERATVYVCPLISGSGVKNRVLEAMAMGKAVVTTSACAEPLGLSAAEASTADEPADFARAVATLLRDEAAATAMGAAARQAIVERFSWEAAVGRVEEILAAL